MSMNPQQFRDHVIRATLQPMGLWSIEAEELLIGTAAHESQLGRYIVQVGGPALGVFQMEPATYWDIYRTFLAFDRKLLSRIDGIVPMTGRTAEHMITDLRYACVMARLKYYRVAEALPAASDLNGQARYWKQHYNTPKGRGTVWQYVAHYRTLVKGELR
jgi:hypothetical protein